MNHLPGAKPRPPGRTIAEQDPGAAGGLGEDNHAWYNYVKGYLPTSNYFGIYDVVRWDTAWLDK